MYNGKLISPAEVDFWLDSEKYFNFFDQSIDSSNSTLAFNVDMIRLASIRKAVANFVRILTRQIIPVYFNDANKNVNFNSKVIFLSSKIENKQDFDVAVGLALHEAAHVIKTDFDIVKIAYANIPKHILTLSDSKYIRRNSLEKFIHTVWNIIEDRYIDDYIFNEAPGYRGYYVALYDRYFNSSAVDAMLLDPELFVYPSLDSYLFRISNFTNINTSLTALPGLEDIAKTIDLTNIGRLTTTKNRIEIAFKITEIVLENLGNIITNSAAGPGDSQDIQNGGDPTDLSDIFDFEDTDESDDSNSSGKSSSKKTPPNDVGSNNIHEIGDVLSGMSTSPDKPIENENLVKKISNNELDKSVEKEIRNTNELQRKFIIGDIQKQSLSESQKSLLDLVEKHGILLVQVPLVNISLGDEKGLKIDCVVCQKMTKDLIFSGQDIFPLTGVMKIGTQSPEPPEKVNDAVIKGISIGTKLGRKLQIRTEINPLKTIRKRMGKINKRHLHEAAFDGDDFFYKIIIEEHKQATLHISVDASSSMTGEKWYKTMTAVVAICKAASMVNNIHVTVSFRTTQTSNLISLPYIVLAYDSKKDKFSKIQQLFPYLEPSGCTPEGLAFGATMNLFTGITPDEESRYFLNLSDGEPYFGLKLPNLSSPIMYVEDVAITHTKHQIEKIRNMGVRILSYFIEEDSKCKMPLGLTPEESKKWNVDNINKLKELDNSPLRQNFRKMYGEDSEFIDVENIIDLTKTINQLFLIKD